MFCVQETEHDELYKGFFDVVERAYKNPQDYHFHTFNSRHENHINVLRKIAHERKLTGLDFLVYELAILGSRRRSGLTEAITALEEINMTISEALASEDLPYLQDLGLYFGARNLSIGDVRDSFNTQSAENLHDIDIRIAQSDSQTMGFFFDILATMLELMRFAHAENAAVVHFHHPA